MKSTNHHTTCTITTPTTPPPYVKQKRATSLLAAALSLAAAMAECSNPAYAPKDDPTKTWRPSPNVTLLGVPRSIEKELLALNATGKQFECKDSRKTKISFDKVCRARG